MTSFVAVSKTSLQNLMQDNTSLKKTNIHKFNKSSYIGKKNTVHTLAAIVHFERFCDHLSGAIRCSAIFL